MKIINLETMSPLVLFFSLLLIVSSWEGVAAAQEKNDFDEPPITGFEDRDGEEWTTHEEELEFLEEVEEKSERMTYSEVGTSVEGRPLHLVQVGGPSPAADEEMADGQNMLIIGSQHGNEPAPREMALQLLRDLAFTEDPEREGQLEELTVMFIPTANPDGREADTRTNAEGVDINREHLNLGTPEIQVIGEVLNQYNPDITIDAHERPSADGNPDMEMQWPRNLNVDDELRELNEEMVEDYLRPNVEEAGFTTGLYGDASEPTLGLETVLSQMAGLRHGLGLLTESSGQQDPKYRVEAQMETVESTLEFYRERMDDVTTVVSEAPSRKMEEGADRSEPFYLDGADIREPEDSDVLDPHPCGYLLHSSQANEVSLHIDSFSLETEEVGENGVFVSMSQPMMTVVPFLLDGEASYNEVEGLALEDCSDPSITASGLQTLVEQLDEAGEFENSDAPYALDVHLRAVSHYEDQEETDKVVEHMGGFHNLLIQQLENDWISEDAFHMLETFADDLIENYGETFDVDRVMDHISHLSEDIGPRVAGSEEELEAAEYIEDEFESLGYDTSMQMFDIRNGEESQNVTAVKEAEGVDNPEIVYLTAHYDSVPDSPGANDNGSGTASLMELARVMKDAPADKEVRFIALGAEEIGLVGAFEYVDQLSDSEIDRSVANFNMDMVGTAWEPATQLYVNVVDGQPNTVWEQADSAAQRLDNDILFLFERGASDHVAFHEAGIDAANFIWREPGTHDLEPWYHTPEDTIDNVSPEKIQQVGDLIDSAVSDLILS